MLTGMISRQRRRVASEKSVRVPGPAEVIENEAVRMIGEGLEAALPGRGLKVARDGNLWKITGDLSLSGLTGPDR